MYSIVVISIAIVGNCKYFNNEALLNIIEPSFTGIRIEDITTVVHKHLSLLIFYELLLLL